MQAVNWSRSAACCPSITELALALMISSLTASGRAEAQEPAREERTHDVPSPLRLAHVVQIARERRGELAAARARARAAAERPGVVSALEDPMISASVDHLPFHLMGADVSLAIEQRFPLSGVRGNRGRVAEAEASRLRAETARVSLDVELQAADAFLMLHERRQMMPVLDQQLALARQLVTAANARYSGGTGAQADVLRAEVEVARFEGAVRSIRGEVRAAEAMLNASLARPADAELPALESAAAVAVPAGWRPVREAALRARPELAAGRAAISRAEADVTVMSSMYSPMALVRTGPAYTMADGPGWMLMVGVSVPIWRDGLGSGVREAEAMVEMSRADLGAMTRMVEGETAAARHVVLASRDRYLSLRDDVIPRTRRVIDPSIAGYAAGTLPLVSVIEAAAALWSAEAELVSAELDLGLAWARLDRAIAGKAERR